MMMLSSDGRADEREGSPLLDSLTKLNVLRRAPTQARSVTRVLAILETATDLCVELGPENLSTALIAERVGVPIGTIYQFFENGSAIIRGVAVRVNAVGEEVIRQELSEFDPGEDWFSAASNAIDRAIDVFLENPELINVLRALNHLPEYQEVNRRAVASLVDAFLNYLSHLGITVTTERRHIAHFALTVGNFCHTMIIFEGDKEHQDFLREQLKLLIANYLPQALVVSGNTQRRGEEK
ncbi:MAG: TetR/AcrR family transcriptional regulator [Pseudomonadota bacterium]